METPNLLEELQTVLNRHSAENGSNTPDFVLAGFLKGCLVAFDAAVQDRANWYQRMDEPGQGSASSGVLSSSPVIVQVGDDESVDDVATAIRICLRYGLLEPPSGGFQVMSAGNWIRGKKVSSGSA